MLTVHSYEIEAEVDPLSKLGGLPFVTLSDVIPENLSEIIFE